MRHFFNFLLLTSGFALATLGLMLWQEQGFSFAGLWSLAQGPHPLFALTVGLAGIPPALWEIFILESQRGDD